MKTINKFFDILIRIIASPFVLGLVLISGFIIVYKFMRDYLLYGGEITAYKSKEDRKTIGEIYYKLETIYKNTIKTDEGKKDIPQ